jgi:hypothetical protein
MRLRCRKSGVRARLVRSGRTCLADANLRLSWSPTARNGGRVVQQVLRVHAPDTPWHLHSVDSRAFNAWWTRKKLV